MAAQRGMYTVTFTAQSFTTANGDYDFVELTPADDRPIELCGWDISVKSEVGDTQEEFLDVTIVTDNATTGNGTSTTPRPLDPRDGAAGFTAEVVSSTPASTGTEILVYATNVPVRGGTGLVLIPEQFRPKVDQADVMMCVRLETALADDATLSGTFFVREL